MKAQILKWLLLYVERNPDSEQVQLASLCMFLGHASLPDVSSKSSFLLGLSMCQNIPLLVTHFSLNLSPTPFLALNLVLNAALTQKPSLTSVSKRVSACVLSYSFQPDLYLHNIYHKLKLFIGWSVYLFSATFPLN